MASSSIRNILVIGAGEPGTEILRSLAKHSKREKSRISVLVRSKQRTRPELEEALKNEKADIAQQIQYVGGNIVHDSEDQLGSIFRGFDLIIGCAGFVAGSGTQLKLARAVLVAKVPFYIPWQFGVDYDVIGRESAQDLFDEQLDIRDLLRSHGQSFPQSTVRALGGWDNQLTFTTLENIGKLTVELILRFDRHKTFANKPIFIGGDTISYRELATLVEKIAQKPFHRTVLTVEQAVDDLAKDPTNSLHKYNAVFVQGRGVAWNLADTWNTQAGIHAFSAEE